mmetsp:Transcript_45166/g.57847  ORF Transcript_45166/g.57847 Transcript_45166/m.57847 type:complete len:132 (+) Transcript_45166:197-592(+)
MLLKRTGPSGLVGLYCYATMIGEDDGVDFTPDDAYPLVIEFHTEESLHIKQSLKSSWSQYRKATTKKQRNNAMLQAQQLSGYVKVPTGARCLTGPKWLREHHRREPTGEFGGDSDDDDTFYSIDGDDDFVF